LLVKERQSEAEVVPMPHEILNNHSSETSNELALFAEANNGNDFLRRFLYSIIVLLLFVI